MDEVTEMVRVELPYQLQTLAHCEPEVRLTVKEPVTLASVIAALEARYPMLQGAVIDHNTGKRRPLLRFFTCGEDWSFASPDSWLPDEVRNGREPLIIIGAISGG